MSFTYVFTLFMFLGSLFGGGNDLLDYIPAEAYWRIKNTPMIFDIMAGEARLADPAAAGNLARAFEAAAGEDRERLAQALIDQGNAAKPELDRLTHSLDLDLVARAKSCLAAIDAAPKTKSVRRLMAIRTLGLLGKKDAVTVLQPLLKSAEPFVADYAAEAIASLDGKPAPARAASAAVKEDLWRLPADCRAVAQVAPNVVAPGLPDAALRDIKLPTGFDKQTSVDGLTTTLIEIADQFGDIRFDGVTLAASGDLGEKAGYLVAIFRGRYDHAAVERAISASHSPFNDTPAGRIYVPGGFAVLAPSDDMLVFAASPDGASPVQAVETCAGDPHAPGRLKESADMVKLIGSIDTTQAAWVACKGTAAYRAIPGLSRLEELTFVARQSAVGTVALQVDANLGTKEAAAAIAAQLPKKPAAGPDSRPAKDPDPQSSMLQTLPGSWSITELEVTDGQFKAAVTIAMTRIEIMRWLLTGMDDGPGPKTGR